MPAFLLTWNPSHWPWPSLPDEVRALANGLTVELRWSCGNTRKIPIGSRVFLLRQGIEPKGIIASGWVTAAPFEALHWDPDRAGPGAHAYFITFSADALLNPETTAPLDLRTFASGPLSTIPLNTQASGISIPDDVSTALAKAWSGHPGATGLSPDTGEFEPGAMEGELSWHFVLHRKRERALRSAKIADARARDPEGRLRCEVPGCGFDFEEVYGAPGAGYAHVHHLRPLAEEETPSLTTMDDLAVVCANCHAIIHRGGACRPIHTLIPSGAE